MTAQLTWKIAERLVQMRVPVSFQNAEWAKPAWQRFWDGEVILLVAEWPDRQILIQFLMPRKELSDLLQSNRKP